MHHRFPFPVFRHPFPVTGPLFLKRGKKPTVLLTCSLFLLFFFICSCIVSLLLTYLGTDLPVLLLIAL